MLQNPYQRDNKWYFYDESDFEHGPFEDKLAAQTALEIYCRDALADDPFGLQAWTLRNTWK